MVMYLMPRFLLLLCQGSRGQRARPRARRRERPSACSAASSL